MIKNQKGNGVTFSFINKEKETLTLTLSKEHNDIFEQAKKDYEISRAYIMKNEYYTWRQAIKSYNMSTNDRKVALGNKSSRKQNISIGLIRSFIDVMVSSLNEKPLTFVGTGVNELGIKNKEKILKTLNYISDVTGFHKELKKAMKNGLIIGEICFRVSYTKSKKTESVATIINDNIVKETFDTEEKNYPTAVSVPIWNIFPDPYKGSLRNVTERGVVDYASFIETFGHLIRSSFNESPFKSDDFLSLLPINQAQAGVVYDDFGNITTQIRQKNNEENRRIDSYSDNRDNIVGTTSNTPDEDVNVTAGLIEFKLTHYNTRTVLNANGFPVYIGKNIYGFIPYIVKSANDPDMRFGDGIPTLLSGLENVANSFINNYFDSARAIANPTVVIQKNLMINDYEVENGEPGGIVYTENNDNGRAIYRLDKGGLNDFNILPLINQIAQQITGISEYNLGISAGERTATGSLSVSQSSQKRLSPYISNFLDSISIIADMWLKLIKKYWNKEQFIYIHDEDGNQVEATIKNNELLGSINISLSAEGLFGAFTELELQKLVTLYQTLSGSGFITSPELAKEIIKKSGFEPSRFIVEPGEGIIPENMKGKELLNPSNPNPMEGGSLPFAGDNTIADPTATISDLLAKATNPQLDLGNGGKGSPFNPNS